MTMKSLLLLLFVGVAVASLPSTADVADREHRPWGAVNQRRLGDGGNLFITQSILPGKEANITVVWQNMTFTGKNDWIGIYEENADVGKDAPIQYRWASSTGRWAPSSGSVWFTIINRRCAYRAIYVSGTMQYWEIYGKSGIVAFEDLYQPLHVHLALTPDVRKTSQYSVDVIWNQKSIRSPGIFVSTDPTEQGTWINATVSYTFLKSDMCDSSTQPAGKEGWFNPGFFIYATLGNLVPGQTYYYRCGDQGFSLSNQTKFTAPPIPSTPVEIYAFGDMGQAPVDRSYQHSWDFNSKGEYPALNTTALLKRLSKSGDMVLHIGDISYAVGFLSEWDQFMHQIEPVASEILWQVGIGNHENGHSGSFFGPMSDSGGECGIPYYSNFPNSMSDVPEVPFKTQAPWYSYNYGPVHVLVTSTEHNFTVGSDQHAWVEKDLSSVDRSVTPWIVFTGHRPMYPDSTWIGDQEVSKMLSDSYEEFFMKYDVNLCLWGHEHVYVRSCPIYLNECLAEGAGPTHIVIGTAGYDLSKTLGHAPYVRYSQNKNYGVLKMSFSPQSHVAQLELLDTATGEALDTFTVTRNSEARRAAYSAFKTRGRK